MPGRILLPEEKLPHPFPNLNSRGATLVARSSRPAGAPQIRIFCDVGIRIALLSGAEPWPEPAWQATITEGKDRAAPRGWLHAPRLSPFAQCSYSSRTAAPI